MKIAALADLNQALPPKEALDGRKYSQSKLATKSFHTCCNRISNFAASQCENVCKAFPGIYLQTKQKVGLRYRDFFRGLGHAFHKSLNRAVPNIAIAFHHVIEKSKERAFATVLLQKPPQKLNFN